MTPDSVLTDVEWQKMCAIMNGYILSQTIATACELDLFGFLDDHEGSDLAGIAEGLDLPRPAARVLLLASCSAGLIDRDPRGRYRNSSLASKVLVADRPYSMVPFVLYNHHVQRPCSTHLTDSLREGRNAGLDEFPGAGNTIYERLEDYPETERLFHSGMAAYTRLTAGSLRLFDLGGVEHLLDVGGGDGSTAVRLCRQYPDLRVTLLDKPSVTELARQTVERERLGHRIRCEAIDLFDEPWPKGCDGVLMSHVVEIFSPSRVGVLYQHAFDALPADGMLFVWTLMCNDSETGGLQAAKSATYFASTASGGGFPYPASDHRAWLRSAGFEQVRVLDASAFDHGAITAVRGSGE